MFSFLANKVTNFLICKNSINDDDREVYQYGFEQLFSTVFNIVSMLLLGAIFGKIYQSLVLTLAFILLRTYSGGYHASTPLRCYCLSVMSISIALSVMKFVIVNNYIYLGLWILSSLVIILFSPVDNVVKPLDEIEKIIYKKKSIIVWCIESCIAFIFFMLQITEIHKSIVLAQLIISVAIVLGKIQKSKNIMEE